MRTALLCSESKPVHNYSLSSCTNDFTLYIEKWQKSDHKMETVLSVAST